MEVLRTARFSTLFGVAFAVGASFLAAIVALCLVLAFVSPGFFTLNGARATNAIQALGATLFMAVTFTIMNAAIAALGSLIWLGLRRFLPKRAAAAVAQA